MNHQKAKAAPILVLCRQCLQYVFEATRDCPHCGGNALEAGAVYSERGYLALEAMQRIDRLRELADRDPPRQDGDPER
jgi:hypothetical protein